MSKTTRLIVDCDNIAYIAFFANRLVGVFNGQKQASVGTIFGFLNQLNRLRDRFGTDNIVLCWDHGPSLRTEEFPFYNADRRRRFQSDTEQLKLQSMKKQCAKLRDQILPELGFRNVLHCKGYEADDVIASITRSSQDDSIHNIIVSTDHDFYQLLKSNVVVFDPRTKTIFGSPSLSRDYQISPSRWPEACAIAGGKSGMTGVFRVKHRTAASYLTGTLSKSTQVYREIQEFVRTEVFLTNLKLCQLPYPGLPACPVRPQPGIDTAVWDETCEKHGLEALVTR